MAEPRRRPNPREVSFSISIAVRISVGLRVQQRGVRLDLGFGFRTSKVMPSHGEPQRSERPGRGTAITPIILGILEGLALARRMWR